MSEVRVDIAHLKAAQKLVTKASTTINRIDPLGETAKDLNDAMVCLDIFFKSIATPPINGPAICFLPQGFEMTRADFGAEIRDHIAFTLAFTMNTGCGNKAALLSLLYSAADEIIEVTNKAKAQWTKIGHGMPSAHLGYVLYRELNPSGTPPWLCGFATYVATPDDEGEGHWRLSNGRLGFDSAAEWMAIPF